MGEMGFRRLLSDAAVYFIEAGTPEDSLVFWVHVDDFFLTGPREERKRILEKLGEIFEMKVTVDLDKDGDHGTLIGRRLIKTEQGFAIETSAEQTKEVVKELGLETAKPASSPCSTTAARAAAKADRDGIPGGGQLS